MSSEFDVEYFMDNLQVLSARVRDAIDDIEEARANQDGTPEPDNEDEKTAIAEAFSTLERFLCEPLEQMARMTLFALEHLNATGLAADLRAEIAACRKDKEGLVKLVSASEEDDTLYSPVEQAIKGYAEAVASNFEFEYGYEFELNWLKKILQRTRSIMLFKGLDNPGSEANVRNAIYDFLRIMYSDVIRDAHIGQPGKTYKPDIGVKHLKAAVEYKYVANAEEVNTAVDGIFADLPAYRGSRDWQWFYAVIYMTDEHVPLPELEKRFEDLPHNWELIVVIGTGERKKKPKKGQKKGGDDPAVNAVEAKADDQPQAVQPADQNPK
jgi:hypothetical protein